MPNHSKIAAASSDKLQPVTACSIEPTIPTVYDSVSWVVEVTKGYQSVHIYMSAPTRDYYSVIICSICKIHRSRKQLPACSYYGREFDVKYNSAKSNVLL